jgi:hypothetical protein
MGGRSGRACPRARPPNRSAKLPETALGCLISKCLFEKCLTVLGHLDRDRARSMTNLRDRFEDTRRPLSRHVITLTAYRQRRSAVGRLIPKRQQIIFQGVFSARAHTSFTSSGASHLNQSRVCSIRSIAAGIGDAGDIGRGVCPTRSSKLGAIAGHSE